MRKFVIITLLLAASVILSGGDRHPSIGKSDYTGEPFLPVIIVVERPGLRDALAPYSEMRGSAKRRMAISTIKEYSAAAQGPIISELNRLAGKGKAASIEAHWLGGCIAFHGTPAAIRQIATRQDVVTVIDNVETKLIEAASNPWNEAGSPSFHKTMLTTWAIRQVKADSVWVLGYEGEELSSACSIQEYVTHTAIYKTGCGIIRTKYPLTASTTTSMASLTIITAMIFTTQIVTPQMTTVTERPAQALSSVMALQAAKPALLPVQS